MAGSKLFASARGRRWLAVALLGFGACQVAQLGATLVGSRCWPFCSYDMFAFRVRSPLRTVRVTLLDDAGKGVHVRPGSILPIEFFRASELVNAVFVNGTDEARKLALARDILRRLRLQPWSGFDETWPAARPEPGRVFVGLHVDVVEERLERTGEGARLVELGARTVFRTPNGMRAGG